MRLDKWLWAARFFKTRSLASKACDLGRVSSFGQPAKPSREVRGGDSLLIKTAAGEFDVEVLALSEQRGPASVAQTLFRESTTGRELRLRLADDRKLNRSFEAVPATKPSKRNRRELDHLRGRE